MQRDWDPQPGAWAQDWHTSQVSVVLFPSSLGVLCLLPIITTPLWKKATVVRNRNTQCLELPWRCLLLTPQEGEWCCRVSPGGLPETQLQWSAGNPANRPEQLVCTSLSNCVISPLKAAGTMSGGFVLHVKGLVCCLRSQYTSAE